MTSTSSFTVLFDKLYQRCLTGGYGLASAYTLAAQHKAHHPFHSDNLDSLIKQEANKAATTGFVTGFGGLVSLPITLPASAASSLFIQMRLIVTIAILQGHDVRDERIKILIYTSLCVMTCKTELQQFCLNILMKQPNVMIQKISLPMAKQLITSLSVKHSLTLTKALPFVGGVTGAVIDRMITYKIGQSAKHQFSLCR